MSQVLIGITRDSDGRPGPTDSHYAWYATSVEKSGGEPLPICYGSDLARIPDILDKISGLVLAGGDDLDPTLWNEPWHPKAKPIAPARQCFELALLAEAEKRRMPIFGICLGIQLMNVHRGGSLIQFLPDYPRQNPLEHRRLDAAIRRHPVRLEPDSILGRTVGQTEISANTYHKQAIKSLGRNLRATAWSPDGIIEAIEDASLPLFLGVQWHPERLHDDAVHLSLFRLLVECSHSL